MPSVRGHIAPSRPHINVPFPDVVEKIEFDPTAIPGREDVDVWRWAHMTGTWPTSQRTTMNNVWKMDPNRDKSALEYHITRGFPTPPSRQQECLCVAQRNARELAEHLGYSDFPSESWPTYNNIVYIPKPNHTNKKVDIHIGDFPTTGKPREAPTGDTAHTIDEATVNSPKKAKHDEKFVNALNKNVKSKKGKDSARIANLEKDMAKIISLFTKAQEDDQSSSDSAEEEQSSDAGSEEKNSDEDAETSPPPEKKKGRRERGHKKSHRKPK